MTQITTNPRALQTQKSPRVDIQDEVIRSGIRLQVVRLYGRTADAVLMELSRRAGRQPDHADFRSCFPSQSRIAEDIGITRRQTVGACIAQLATAGIISKWQEGNRGTQGRITHYRIADTADLKTIAGNLSLQEKRPRPATNQNNSVSRSHGGNTKKRTTDPVFTSARGGHKTVFVSGQGGHMEDHKEGRKEEYDLDQSFLHLAEAQNDNDQEQDAIALNLAMLTHPDVNFRGRGAQAIANIHRPETVYAVIAQFLKDRADGQNITNRVLPKRFADPNNFPLDPSAYVRGLDWFHDFPDPAITDDQSQVPPVEEHAPHDTQDQPQRQARLSAGPAAPVACSRPSQNDDPAPSTAADEPDSTKETRLRISNLELTIQAANLRDAVLPADITAIEEAEKEIKALKLKLKQPPPAQDQAHTQPDTQPQEPDQTLFDNARAGDIEYRKAQMSHRKGARNHASRARQPFTPALEGNSQTATPLPPA